MKYHQVTRLGRKFDFGLTSNRIGLFAPVGSGVVFAVWDVVSGRGFRIVEAALAGVSAFLAWSTARELDPDDTRTATLAIFLATAAAFGPWESPLLIAAVALVGLRALAGTVGGDLRPADLAVLVVGAGFAGSRIEGWVIVLLILMAILDNRPRGYLTAMAAAAAAAIISALAFDVSLPDQNMTDEVGLWVVVVVVAIVLSARRTVIVSTTDVYQREIFWPNIRATRVMAGFVVAGALLASGPDTVVLLVPTLSALVATAALRTIQY